ncbi:MAG: DUF2336 domain-containing protein [Alphaproteobacteria bacterium]
MGVQKPARAQDLIELARHDSDEDRARLYGRIADLFQLPSASRSETERGLLIEIMRALSVQVDMRLRLALAERLADRGDADHSLILLLAHDEIEVAAPVIARSIVLTESDLVSIIRECSPRHSVTVAGRPAISARVCEALVETNRSDVFRVLTRNETAEIPPKTLEQLVDVSRHDPDLVDALAGRRLPQSLAIRLFSWASVALKKHIAERYDIDPAVLEAELARSVSQELSRAPAIDHNRAKMLASLVDKMRANGQLKPGFLLKAVRDGQMDIFRVAFARMLEVDQATGDRILGGNDVVQIARATRAVGIDRSAFPAIIAKLCGSGALDELADDMRAEVDAALSVSPPSLAREALLSA